MKDRYAALISTKCPSCLFSYMRPITAEEMIRIRGKASEPVMCDKCREKMFLDIMEQIGSECEAHTPTR